MSTWGGREIKGVDEEKGGVDGEKGEDGVKGGVNGVSEECCVD